MFPMFRSTGLALTFLCIFLGGGGGGGGWDGSGLRQKTYNDVGMTHSYGHHVTFLLYNIR